MPVSDINRVILVGRLTRDPELRNLPSGIPVCSLRLACNHLRKDPQGEYQSKPNYFSVSVFGAQAEAVARHMTRGERLAVDGRLDWSEWETADGARRQAVDILADRVEFLGSPAEHAEQEPAGDKDPGEQPGRELAGVGSALGDEVTF